MVGFHQFQLSLRRVSNFFSIVSIDEKYESISLTDHLHLWRCTTLDRLFIKLHGERQEFACIIEFQHLEYSGANLMTSMMQP